MGIRAALLLALAFACVALAQAGYKHTPCGRTPKCGGKLRCEESVKKFKKHGKTIKKSVYEWNCYYPKPEHHHGGWPHDGPHDGPDGPPEGPPHGPPHGGPKPPTEECKPGDKKPCSFFDDDCANPKGWAYCTDDCKWNKKQCFKPPPPPKEQCHPGEQKFCKDFNKPCGNPYGYVTCDDDCQWDFEDCYYGRPYPPPTCIPGTEKSCKYFDQCANPNAIACCTQEYEWDLSKCFGPKGPPPAPWKKPVCWNGDKKIWGQIDPFCKYPLKEACCVHGRWV